MWIMTSYGIIMPAAIPANVRPFYPYDGWDDDWDFQIRARDRKALTKVRKRLIADGAEPSKNVPTPTRDYEYRMYVNRWTFAAFMQEEIVAIDYTKFKPTTERRGGGGAKLHNLYTRIWFAVAEAYDSPILRPTRGKRTR